MALLGTCFCCSLLTAAILAGMISTFLYSVAFALEIWSIIEVKVPLAVPAYILSAGYLMMVFLSLLLLLGLRTKQTRLLMSWMLANMMYIFPEAGLVLFMAIKHWSEETYGIIELSLWSLRVTINVFGIVCVQSLWSFWRDEKSIFRSLQELGNTHGGIVSNGVGESGLGIPGSVKLRGSLRYSNSNQGLPGYQDVRVGNFSAPLGYSNPGFHGSSAQIHGSLAVTNYLGSTLKRKSSSGFVSASRLSLPTVHSYTNQLVQNQLYNKGDYGGLDYAVRSQGLDYSGHSRSQSRSQGLDYSGHSRSQSRSQGLDYSGLSRSHSKSQDYTGASRSQSQADLPSFGLDPDQPLFIQGSYGPGGLPVNIYRGNSRREKILSDHGMEWYKPRSLGNLTVDLDTLSIWSGGQKYNDRSYNNHVGSSADRKYRASSLGNINLGNGGVPMDIWQEFSNTGGHHHDGGHHGHHHHSGGHNIDGAGYHVGNGGHHVGNGGHHVGNGGHHIGSAGHNGGHHGGHHGGPHGSNGGHHEFRSSTGSKQSLGQVSGVSKQSLGQVSGVQSLGQVSGVSDNPERYRDIAL